MEGILNALNAGSGLATGQIIRDLVAAESAPRTAQINAQRTAASARISALGQIRASIGAFSQALGALTTSGALGVQTSVNRPDQVSVSVTSPTARPQALNFEVLSLAARQTVVSAGLASSDAAIGTGVLTIRMGEAAVDANGSMTGFVADPARSPVTIVIGEGAATLQGVVDRINTSAAGFTASILNDGGTARLVLKGPSGEANAFNVDVAADSAGSELEKLAFAPGGAGMTLSQAAADAKLLVEGIAVSRDSNRIVDLAEGIAIELQKAEPGVSVTLAADYDRAELATAISNFVDAFNEMQSLLGDLAGRGVNDSGDRPLRGSRAVRDLQSQLRALTTLPLLPDGGVSRLADIGIRSNRDGTLALDTAMLGGIMASNPERIGRLFIDSQSETYPGIRLAGGLDLAVPGKYRLTDIIAATGGGLEGASVPAAFDTPLVIDADNQAFRIAVDGVESLTLSIAEGSYTSGDALAAALGRAIERDPLFRSTGVSASIVWTGTHFAFASRSVGVTSTLSVTAMDPTLRTRLGLDSTVAVNGTDGSGSIDGQAMTATGRRLTAPPGSTVAGMTFDVQQNLESGVFEVSHGINTRLAGIARAVGRTDSAFGSGLAALDREIGKLADDERKVAARSAAYEGRLRKQFGAMEAAVAGFKATQDFLQQQIDIFTNRKQ